MEADLSDELQDSEVETDSDEDGSDVEEETQLVLTAPTLTPPATPAAKKRNRNKPITPTQRKKALTAAEKVIRKGEKLAEKKAKQAALVSIGWTTVDQKTIAFMPPALGPMDSQFARLSLKYSRLPEDQLLLTFYLDMFDDSLLAAMEEDIPVKAFHFQRPGHCNWLITPSRQHQAIAVYFRISAMQNGPKRHAPGKYGLLDAMKEAREHFKVFSGWGIVGIDILKKLLAHFLIRPQHSALLELEYAKLSKMPGPLCFC